MSVTANTEAWGGFESFMDRNLAKELLRFTTAGSVDDGKSTLIGRLRPDGSVEAAFGSAGVVAIHSSLFPFILEMTVTPAPGGSVAALRPEMVRIFAAAATADPELGNRFRGTVRELVYVGDVTTYIVALDNGQKIESLLPNVSSGRTRFFEIDDPVQVAWRHDAGHFVLG